MQKCAGCFIPRYCCREHQKEHWQYHKVQCKEVIARNKEAKKTARLNEVIDDLTLNMKGEQDEAIEMYRRTLAVDPDDIHALYNCGLALKKKGKYEEAIEMYRRALAIDPKL